MSEFLNFESKLTDLRGSSGYTGFSWVLRILLVVSFNKQVSVGISVIVPRRSPSFISFICLFYWRCGFSISFHFVLLGFNGFYWVPHSSLDSVVARKRRRYASLSHFVVFFNFFFLLIGWSHWGRWLSVFSLVLQVFLWFLAIPLSAAVVNQKSDFTSFFTVPLWIFIVAAALLKLPPFY